jgi:hypothetical protein
VSTLNIHDPTPREAARREGDNRRIFRLALGGCAGLAAWLAFKTEIEEPLLIALGLVALALSVWPMLRWCRGRDAEQLPVFAAFMLTFTPFYVLPLFDQYRATAIFGDDAQAVAMLAVIATMGAAQLAHQLTPDREGPRWWRAPLIDRQLPAFSQIGLGLYLVYATLNQFTRVIPSEINSIVLAMVSGVGVLSIYAQGKLWGAGQLSSGAKIYFAITFTLLCAVTITGLYLIQMMSLCILGLAAYVMERRRVPLVLCVAGVALLAVLHLGKDQMRTIYWQEKRPPPTVTDLPDFLTEWFNAGLNYYRESRAPLTDRLMERASLLHVMCIVTKQVPSLQPHLHGATYESIPYMLVPRFFMPDKPGPHAGAKRLAVMFGFVHENDADRTSVAFGMPAESFANFGLPGCLGLGALLGVFFRRLGALARGSAPLSFGGLSMILLLAWSFQAEMTLAVWISSLFQAAAVTIGLPFIIKKITT